MTYTSNDGTAREALQDVTLSVMPGEIIALLGPSGCGKSTLLHTLGGMATPTVGEVRLDGQLITKPKPDLAAYVFQDYSLLPWKNIVDNVAIGLRFAGTPKAKRTKKALELLDLFGLLHVARSYPHQLSGGMQQRVGVARALAMDPKVLLMDEPFGALDEQLRRNIALDMGRLLTETGQTVIMVTHSLDEAIFWADRVLVMQAGPGRIVAEVPVTEPRPRRLDFIARSDFGEMRAELFNLLGSPAEASSNAGGPAAPGRSVAGV